jgi:hypothetical protein
MEKSRIIEMVYSEINRAELLHPVFAENIFKAIAVIMEELGELSQASLDYTDNGGDFLDVITEGTHVAATALRFLFNVSRYKENV